MPRATFLEWKKPPPLPREALAWVVAPEAASPALPQMLMRMTLGGCSRSWGRGRPARPLNRSALRWLRGSTKLGGGRAPLP